MYLDGDFDVLVELVLVDALWLVAALEERLAVLVVDAVVVVAEDVDQVLGVDRARAVRVHPAELLLRQPLQVVVVLLDVAQMSDDVLREVNHLDFLSRQFLLFLLLVI